MRFYKLDNSGKIRIKVLDVNPELRGEGEGSETEHKRKHVCNGDDDGLALPGPVEGIVRVVSWLRNQDRTLRAGFFDEVVCTKICHDLSTRQDLNMQLLFELLPLFLTVNIDGMCHRSHGNSCFYPLT